MKQQKKKAEVYSKSNGLPSRVPKKKMGWLDYAKVTCRQILDNAERQKLPPPTICFLLDDECVDFGPFVFPTVPRRGDFIEPAWLGQKFDSSSFAYEVIAVKHCVPVAEYCEVPHVLLYVRLNNNHLGAIHSDADEQEEKRESYSTKRK